MLKHVPNQKQKNFPYCINETKEFKEEEEKNKEENKEEEKKIEDKKIEEKKKEEKIEEEKKENICSQYCDIVKQLITNSETQIICANEIIRDDSFIQLLSNLNHHTPKVKKNK